MIRWNEASSRLGIYRDTENGWIAGVCAGIAARFSIRPVWVRLVFGLLALTTHGIAGIALYFLLAFLLKPRAGAMADATPAGVEMAYRDIAKTMTAPFDPAPGQHASTLQSRFAALDQRMCRLEEAVLNGELSLRREFKDLGA